MLDTTLPNLPVHPTKRHALTGEPLVAVLVGRNGRVFWPIMGGAPDPEPPAPVPTPPAPPAPDPAPPVDDLGFPKDTPVAEMTPEQRAAYWQDKARKHEGRVKSVLGDRTPEQIKADLDELAQLKKAQLTPAEQQLTEAREQGRAEAVTAERQKAAAAIFRGALESGGLVGADLEELVANFNVAGYITDAGVDSTKITNFAKRFSPGKGNQERPRNFGGGARPEGAPERGAAGKAMAEKRFPKKQTTSTT